MQEAIPADVRQFALQHIDSIAHMEALLLLWREPQQTWAAENVATRLYVDVTTATAVMERLHVLGLAQKDRDLYRYGCSSSTTHDLVSRLAALYATHLIPVTNLIHSKRDSRIREFADAFKLRKGH